MSTADRIPSPPQAQSVPAPDQRPRRGRRIVGRIAVALVVAGAGFGWSTYQGHRDSAAAPAVGECFQNRDDGQDVEKVDCSAAEAEWKVTSRADGTHDAAQACGSDPDAVAGFEYERRSHSVDVTEFVLCAQPT